MGINLSLGSISYLASGFLYLFLLTIYFVSNRQDRLSKPFLILLCVTIIWNGLLSLILIRASIAFEIVMIAEQMRYFAWFYLLYTATGYYLPANVGFKLSNLLTPSSFTAVFILALITLSSNDFWVFWLELPYSNLLYFSWSLFFSVLGMLLVEQVIRNTPSTNRGSIIFLCISAGAIFAYDFFVYSNAMLVHSLDYKLWSARGIVNIIVVPTLVLAAVRNPGMAPDMHMSRKFIFHSTTLVVAGIYLIFMAIIGFYIKESSSEWGKLIQAAFLFAALLLLAVLFFSPKVKLILKRYLSYSFMNKYDYREEWNRFSQTLLIPNPDLSLQQRAVQATGQIVDSQGGSLWTRERGHYYYKASWKHAAGVSQSISENSRIIQFLLKQREPFEGSRLRGRLDDDETIDPGSRELANSWLILPLWINEELFGFVNLLPPIVDFDLSIEDIDLLSTVAHHVSLALFLKEADIKLQEAQRFKDLNQMTAFLVHDLKTVFSQLSLLVENANEHKQNPEFVDDMISTVDHTTRKMQRLLQQLRNPEKEITQLKFPLIPILEEIAASYQHLPANVTLDFEGGKIPKVRADRQQLASAIKHIVQNGVESVGKNGQVKMIAKHLDKNVIELVIEDDGEGMAPEFINDRLFKPFETTKGVSGMGVGVYQSREYIRSISGEIEVSSEPGIGTRFKILMPVDYE